jgi:hypothetical protein
MYALAIIFIVLICTLSLWILTVLYGIYNFLLKQEEERKTRESDFLASASLIEDPQKFSANDPFFAFDDKFQNNKN